jgi:hypothetical protein
MRNLILGALALMLIHCGAVTPLANLGEAVRDDDGDGWFNNPNNQRVTLKLEALNLPGGKYHVVAEGIRQPFASGFDGTIDARDMQATTVNFTITSRVIGTWLLDAPNQVVTFTTPVEVVRDDGTSFTTNLQWSNHDERRDVIIGSESGGRDWVGRFTVSVERFADPNPNDANADGDRDGITEIEEAALAARGGPLGDPARRDLVLVVVNTNQDWGITALSRSQLLSRFRERGINLYLAWEAGDRNVVDAAPGTVDSVARTWRPALVDAPAVRDVHIFGQARNYAHLLILAIRPALDDADYGISNGGSHNANSLICRSHLWEPLIGPDFREYQAKCIMHELGHSICHPSESDSSCPTGAIPASERDSGTTVMGSPAEDRGNVIMQATNAWNRPLDYSPTQWSNVNLTRVRP